MLMASLSGCVRRTVVVAPNGTVNAYSNLQRATKGSGPFVEHPQKGWEMRWGGTDGSVITRWQTRGHWPNRATTEEQLVWIGLSAVSCADASGSVFLPDSSTGERLKLLEVEQRQRGVWAAEWLAALGWPQAWRPVWVLEFGVEGEIVVEWESPSSERVVSTDATPCLVGWIGLPARAYWMGYSPERYADEIGLPRVRAP